MRKFLPFLAVALFLLSASTVVTADALGQSGEKDAGYFRYPAVHGNTVVFTAEGDLWRVPVQGGTALRITTHPGVESHAAISPDGTQLAFSAAYDGPPEVYVMPLAGGLPRRVTFSGSCAIALGWTPDQRVLYTTRSPVGTDHQPALFAVDPKSLARQTYPLSYATEAALDEKGAMLFFARNGLDLRGDHANGYRGGASATLWRYPVDGKSEATQLAREFGGALRTPMLAHGRVYFLSDHDGTFNLWSMDPQGGDLRQHTHAKGWDVRNANSDGQRIVYQIGADLHVFDSGEESDKPIAIHLVSDFAQEREHRVVNPLRYFESAIFSARGDRVAVTSRGRIAIAGVDSTRRVEVAIPAGTRARKAALSVDNQTVYAICDTSGENELCSFAADGSGAAKVLTHDGKNVFRWDLSLSPDGKGIAHSDKQGRIWLYDVAAGTNNLIADRMADRNDSIEAMTWSHDSQALGIARHESRAGRSQLSLIDITTRQTHLLTSDRYDTRDLTFSRDGHWLYFLSDRNFVASDASPWRDRNFGPNFDKRTNVFALALQPGLRFPFQHADELSPARADKSATDAKATHDRPDDKEANKSEAATKPSSGLQAIQYEGLARRLFEVPVEAGNYARIDSDGKYLYLLSTRESAGTKPLLQTLEINNRDPKLETLSADIADFALSNDGKKIFLRRSANEGPGEMLVVAADAKLPPDVSKSVVRINDWAIVIDPREEWRSIFQDAWLVHRDFLYDPALRGLDWPALRQKYEPLLARVGDRDELDDLLGMLMGEFGALHSQIRGGDLRHAEDGSAPAFLGAQVERSAQGFRITHLYRGEWELPETRGPLLRADLHIGEGDTIVAANGRDATSADDLSELLRNQAGQQVLLQIAPRTGTPYKVVVTAIDAGREAALHYGDWEQRGAEHVREASKGSIGYLHLRSMTPAALETFAREFYANLDRDGLIIDVRDNDGGNIDSWIIEKLLRRAWMYWGNNNGGTPQTNMQFAFRGKIAVLINEYTYSDGETFAAGIQQLKIGPLIGKRTAGAGVWLSDRERLVDRGIARVAELPQFLPDGRWLIENIGVSPDIEIDNPPHASFVGTDAQLDAAVQYLQKEIATHPAAVLNPQPAMKR
jgi:tricorn protease